MNHQVALLFRKFCEIEGTDYKLGKKIYMLLTSFQKAQMVTAMKKTIEKEKLKKQLTQSAVIEKQLKV